MASEQKKKLKYCKLKYMSHPHTGIHRQCTRQRRRDFEAAIRRRCRSVRRCRVIFHSGFHPVCCLPFIVHRHIIIIIMRRLRLPLLLPLRPLYTLCRPSLPLARNKKLVDRAVVVLADRIRTIDLDGNFHLFFFIEYIYSKLF